MLLLTELAVEAAVRPYLPHVKRDDAHDQKPRQAKSKTLPGLRENT